MKNVSHKWLTKSIEQHKFWKKNLEWEANITWCMVVIKQGRIESSVWQKLNNATYRWLVRWKHFISLNMQITFGGKILRMFFGGWGILGDCFFTHKEIEIVAGN
jgi:hypothetical protein